MRRARREVPPICRAIRTTIYKTFIMKTETIHNEKHPLLCLKKTRKKCYYFEYISPKREQTDQKKLPETVKFYNETKFGVDIVDDCTKVHRKCWKSEMNR